MTLSRRSALLLPWGLSQARATAPPIAIGGTGGALGTLRALGHGFHRLSGHTLQIVPSLGTQGGIRAVADGKIDIAVVGRAPNPAEQARGVQVMHELRTPFGFVTSIALPPSLAPEVIASYLIEPRMRWPDGSEVRPILRPANESDYLIMNRYFPGIDAAIARLRQRGDIPVASTDQENLDLAEQTQGSLVAATLAQVVTERRNLRFIPINGIRPSLEALEGGAYPGEKTFYLLTRHGGPPAAAAFVDFIASADGKATLRLCGCLI